MNLQKKSNKKAYMQKAENMAVTGLLVCLLFVTAFLAISSIQRSYYPPMDGGTIFEVFDSAGKHILFLAGIGIGLSVFYFLFHKWEKYQEKIAGITLVVAAFWILATGMYYVHNHCYYPVGDQINTTAAAAYARQGNYLMFANGGYIGMYEQQKGLVFLYEILFTVFGDFCYDIVAKIHVVLSVVTLFAGYGFLKCVTDNPFCRVLYNVLMMFCMPYMIYLPYAYGDLPSICFCMVLFWALASYAKDWKKRYVIIGAVAAALALMTRMNTWIVLIAVAIGMVLFAMNQRNIRPLLVGLCVILVAAGSVKSVDAFYEHRSGLESGVGIPAILWIAMGLQKTDGNPGVYNRYQQSVFADCNFEQEPAKEIGKQYIKERLAEMKDDPEYTKDFFTKKVEMQWLEPLFESLIATESFDEDKVVPGWLDSLYYGKLHDLIWKLSNYYQSVVYVALLGLVVTCFWTKRYSWQSVVAWIPLIAFLGGFLFSIMWENQCRYVMPYYVFMVMYAAVGLGRIAESVNAVIKRFAVKNSEATKADVSSKVA